MTSKIKNILIYSTLGGLLVIGGLYAKRKIYDPRHRVDNAISEVKSLVKENEIQNGDLIFQTSLSGQSKAIQFATKSKYSHCGLIYKEGNEYFVVKWIARGENGHYVIKRLKNSDSVLTPTSLKKMRAAGEQFVGKNYDLTFEWSDDKIYCSELIWKIYQRATGIEIGELQKLSDFDLSNKVVKQKMLERYGDKIPMDEVVISPASVFDSELLKTVKSN
jgi:Permuted papain-like amidase enzyme, YaeF/YiiX, C92 family